MSARGLTGQLTLAAEGRRYCVAFHAGTVVGATSPLALDAASRVALQAGLISQPQVAEIARRQATQPNRDEVDVVIETAGLPPEHGPRLRRRVVAARDPRTFAIERGDFVVHDQIAIPCEPAGLDVRTIIYLGARTHMTDPRLTAELAQLGDYFALTPNAAHDLPQFGFSPNDQPILELLGVGASLDDLAAASHALEPRLMRGMVYWLAACGLCSTDPNALTLRPPAAPPPARERAASRAPKRQGSTVPPATVPATLPVAPPGGLPPGGLPPAGPARGLQPMRATPTAKPAATLPPPPRAAHPQLTAPSRVVRNNPASAPPARGQQPPGRGGPPNRGLDEPTLDMGGPTLDMGGPTLDMGGPTLDMGGPAMSMGFPDVEPNDGPVDMDDGGGMGGGMGDDLLDLDGPPAAPPPPPVRTTRGLPTASPAGLSPLSRPTPASRPPPASMPSRPTPTSMSARSAPQDLPPPKAAPGVGARPFPQPARPTMQPQRGLPTVQAGGPTRARALSRAAPKPERIAEVKALIDAKAKLVHDGADHFTLLGVTREASDAEIKKAYFALARQLHPDQLTSLSLRDEMATAQRVFAQINTAQAVLGDPRRRAEYLGIVARGGEAVVRKQEREAEELAMKAIEAEDAFRRGEGALRTNQLAAAVRELQKAIELNPDEVDYHAVLAWAKFCQASDKPSAAQVTRKALENAVRKSAEPATARLYLGRLERMLGRDQDAVRQFRAVLELDPNHCEATAVLRVLEQRLGCARSRR